MEKTKAFEPNRLLIAITLIVLTGIIIYIYLALSIQNQPTSLPWHELSSVGWVSDVS